MSISTPFNLMQWIAVHEHEFKAPVMNKQFYKEANDVIVFVSKGPNTRNDYHVNPKEELFYQLKGDIAVRIRPLDGTPPREVIIREGEMWLCPKDVPHRPQRPADTLGLIVEFPRQGPEYLRWYCNSDEHLVHQAEFKLEHIDRDLHRIMDAFWNGPEDVRTCPECKTVVERANEFSLDTVS